MPSDSLPRELMPSFLDRLIDAGRSGASIHAEGYTLDQIIDAVRADLEELLNTRRGFVLDDCPYPEVKNSIIGYGLPDLNSVAGVAARNNDALSEMIEQVVERYEPRLRRVRAHLVSDDFGDDNPKQVRFHIDALLCVDPAPEVGFETVLELTTGHTTIKTSTGMG